MSKISNTKTTTNSNTQSSLKAKVYSLWVTVEQFKSVNIAQTKIKSGKIWISPKLQGGYTTDTFVKAMNEQQQPFKQKIWNSDDCDRLLPSKRLIGITTKEQERLKANMLKIFEHLTKCIASNSSNITSTATQVTNIKSVSSNASETCNGLTNSKTDTDTENIATTTKTNDNIKNEGCKKRTFEQFNESTALMQNLISELNDTKKKISTFNSLFEDLPPFKRQRLISSNSCNKHDADGATICAGADIEELKHKIQLQEQQILELKKEKHNQMIMIQQLNENMIAKDKEINLLNKRIHNLKKNDFKSNNNNVNENSVQSPTIKTLHQKIRRRDAVIANQCTKRVVNPNANSKSQRTRDKRDFKNGKLNVHALGDNRMNALLIDQVKHSATLQNKVIPIVAPAIASDITNEMIEYKNSDRQIYKQRLTQMRTSNSQRDWSKIRMCMEYDRQREINNNGQLHNKRYGAKSVAKTSFNTPMNAGFAHDKKVRLVLNKLKYNSEYKCIFDLKLSSKSVVCSFEGIDKLLDLSLRSLGTLGYYTLNYNEPRREGPLLEDGSFGTQTLVWDISFDGTGVRNTSHNAVTSICWKLEGLAIKAVARYFLFNFGCHLRISDTN